MHSGHHLLWTSQEIGSYHFFPRSAFVRSCWPCGFDSKNVLPGEWELVDSRKKSGDHRRSPVDMENIRFFTGLFTSQVVQDRCRISSINSIMWWTICFFFQFSCHSLFKKVGSWFVVFFFSMDRCYSSCCVWHLCELCVVYFHGALRWEINP